jgi:hypothetical protein
MIVSLIIIFYIYQYFNILDFGLLNELCERGVAKIWFEKNANYFNKWYFMIFKDFLKFWRGNLK